MIPKTTTYKQFKEKTAREEVAALAATSVAPGQTTLQNGFGGALSAGHLDLQPEASPREDSNGTPATTRLRLQVNESPMADRTLNSSVHGHPSQLMEADVEMKEQNIS